MLNCFSHTSPQTAIPIHLIHQHELSTWMEQQPVLIYNWISALAFRAEPGEAVLVPDENGNLSSVVCGISNQFSLWDMGHLPHLLPQAVYQLIESDQRKLILYATAWGLGAYQFTRYKQAKRRPALLYLANNMAVEVERTVTALYRVRDLINIPTEEMGPSEFAAAAKSFSKQYDATFTEIVGEELLKENYAAIHTVGRASDDLPRLLDIRWGKASHPKITLVGKGVCFDSGGLDIKGAPYMSLMKKDMAGGAHVLGLAQMMMEAKLPICLRILIPVVENVISGNAYRPGDVIKSRQGKTIEIGNTDAEGRLILAEALDEAGKEKPDLLIDIATLTGAARIALGTDLPVFFTNDDQLANDITRYSEQEQDPMWRLPLYQPYEELLNSPIADINNASIEPYAGAITAALFLQHFVPAVPWIHFDIMAWNLRLRPGRPVGGEAMAIRALFNYLKNKYKQ